MARYYVVADSEEEAWREIRKYGSTAVFTEPAPAAQAASEQRLAGWPTEVFVTGPMQALDREGDPDGKECTSCGRKFRSHWANPEFCGWCEGKAE